MFPRTVSLHNICARNVYAPGKYSTKHSHADREVMPNSAEPQGISHVGVVGGGAWGTALAQAAAKAGRQVTLWAREAEVVGQINAARENKTFLPGVSLSRAIQAVGDIRAMADAHALLLVCPAQHLR